MSLCGCDFGGCFFTSGGGAPVVEDEVFVRLTEDRSTSDTAFSDVTDLFFDVEAGGVYQFWANLVFRSTQTGGMALSYNGPAAPVRILFTNGFTIGAGSGARRMGRAYDTSTASPALVANTDTPAISHGIFTNGVTAGTLQLRFASGSAGQTKTIKAGSILVWQKVSA